MGANHQHAEIDIPTTTPDTVINMHVAYHKGDKSARAKMLNRVTNGRYHLTVTRFDIKRDATGSSRVCIIDCDPKQRANLGEMSGNFNAGHLEMMMRTLPKNAIALKPLLYVLDKEQLTLAPDGIGAAWIESIASMPALAPSPAVV